MASCDATLDRIMHVNIKLHAICPLATGKRKIYIFKLDQSFDISIGLDLMHWMRALITPTSIRPKTLH